MDLREVEGKRPLVAVSAYVDPKAILIGDVIVEEGVGIWPGAVIRADEARIVLKKGTMVLENAIIEAAKGQPLSIGPGAVISHGAIVHGANIGENSTVGIGAIVLDQAVVYARAVIGSGALVPPGKEIPGGKLVLGIPGKVVRELTPEDQENNLKEWLLLEEKVKKYQHGSS